MTVIIVETYAIKPEKQSEFKPLLRKWRTYMKENKEKLKEMKSWKLYMQTFGSLTGAYIEQIQYDSLAEHEKLNARLQKDKEFMKLYQAVMAIIDTSTFSMCAWEPVK
jgi:hypothetical protein